MQSRKSPLNAKLPITARSVDRLRRAVVAVRRRGGPPSWRSAVVAVRRETSTGGMPSQGAFMELVRAASGLLMVNAKRRGRL